MVLNEISLPAKDLGSGKFFAFSLFGFLAERTVFLIAVSTDMFSQNFLGLDKFGCLLLAFYRSQFP